MPPGVNSLKLHPSQAFLRTRGASDPADAPDVTSCAAIRAPFGYSAPLSNTVTGSSMAYDEELGRADEEPGPDRGGRTRAREGGADCGARLECEGSARAVEAPRAGKEVHGRRVLQRRRGRYLHRARAPQRRRGGSRSAAAQAPRSGGGRGEEGRRRWMQPSPGTPLQCE